MIKSNAEGNALGLDAQSTALPDHRIAQRDDSVGGGNSQTKCEATSQCSPRAVTDFRQTNDISARQVKQYGHAESSPGDCRQRALRNSPERMDHIKSGTAVLAAKIAEHARTSSQRTLPTCIVNLCAQERPLIAFGFLAKRENMHLVSAFDQPLDEPEQTGYDALDTASINTTGRDYCDLHRRSFETVASPAIIAS
jgi:hypothetical protein